MSISRFKPNFDTPFRDLITYWKSAYPGKDRLASSKLLGQAIRDFEGFTNELDRYLGENKEDINAEGEWIKEGFNKVINVYWEPLERTTLQRDSEPYKKFLFEQKDSAEYLTRKYLNKLATDFKLRLPEALLYINKIAKIQRYPYTDIPIIGIPYRPLTKGKNKFPAIAHEIGHHVYWNMATFEKLEEIHNKFQQGFRDKMNKTRPEIINMVMEWFEEIFADVIGARLAEDAFLESYLEITRRSVDDKKTFLFNDGTHPPYSLRTVVISHVLNNNSRQNSMKWESFLGGFDSRSTERIPIPEKNGPFTALQSLIGIALPPATVTLGEVAEILAQVVDYINSELEMHANGNSSKFSSRSEPLTPGLAVMQLAEIARSNAKRKGGNAVKNLLNPFILEGGSEVTHAHTTYTYGWSDAHYFTHTHY